MDVILLYSTAPDAETAERLGAALVDEGLAACINVIPDMRSVYRWQGAVERSAEAVLIVKTTRAAAAAASARLRALHPYEVPCILELPIAGGDAAYLAWLAAAVRPAPPIPPAPPGSRA
ncbi:MAG: divalent-cation tolerance protein CutA [Planctomycetota bacterium]|nr:divalent-cation tolerance protein CutA [Planctomycetota bacterium]MCX8040158.1 divalent-cation tolerance protein CutA [Planctomycetota bacterium]MDW8372547.1 divalent-cation tolerance protein CutA [Planctomycetota bacterium]